MPRVRPGEAYDAGDENHSGGRSGLWSKRRQRPRGRGEMGGKRTACSHRSRGCARRVRGEDEVEQIEGDSAAAMAERRWTMATNSSSPGRARATRRRRQGPRSFRTRSGGLGTRVSASSTGGAHGRVRLPKKPSERGGEGENWAARASRERERRSVGILYAWGNHGMLDTTPSAAGRQQRAQALPWLLCFSQRREKGRLGPGFLHCR